MAKVTVRIKYPKRSAEKLLALYKNIVERHLELGNASPLTTLSRLNMQTFETLVHQADAKRSKSIQLKAESEALMQAANSIIGIDKGQTSINEGTLLNMMLTIKGLLLLHHQGEEEMLSQYGFGVVVGTARLPRKKKKEVKITNKE